MVNQIKQDKRMLRSNKRIVYQRAQNYDNWLSLICIWIIQNNPVATIDQYRVLGMASSSLESESRNKPFLSADGVVRFAMGMVGKTAISSTFAMLFVYTAELFPTPLR